MPEPALFDPARHEPLISAAWSEAAARAAISRIVEDAQRDFSPQMLWPAHSLDEPATPDTRYSMLYLGAGGVIWALRALAADGLADDVQRFDSTVPTLLQRNREVGETQYGTASWLMGDAGLLMLEWQQTHDPALADRLHQVVVDNLHHPAREMLWGSPGTMLAAVHMAEATGEARWSAIVERNARVLWDEMEFDEGLRVWMWRQDLYGRSRRLIGAGHGFAGNLFPLLRGAALLPADLVAAFVDRALATLNALALKRRIDAADCINWHPVHDPVAIVGKLPPVQDCHGAPGVVCRLADAPRMAAWDGLLEAAGELTWAAGPLVKGPGLCHGTAGNGYALLKLWSRSGDARWLVRARAFAMHAIDQVDRARATHGRARHSLWTGDIGVALYLRDCIAGIGAFPTMDVC